MSVLHIPTGTVLPYSITNIRLLYFITCNSSYEVMRVLESRGMNSFFLVLYRHRIVPDGSYAELYNWFQQNTCIDEFMEI